MGMPDCPNLFLFLKRCVSLFSKDDAKSVEVITKSIAKDMQLDREEGKTRMQYQYVTPMVVDVFGGMWMP